MNKRLYVDFHILQTVPPSCINRDDTGSPKTAVYGGVLRARVSSQAWKHAMRAAFAENARLDVHLPLVPRMARSKSASTAETGISKPYTSSEVPSE